MELTDLQRAKLELRFRQMDKNNNGFLERDDYEAMAARLIRASGVGEGSSAARMMRAYAVGMFEALATKLDTDRDGRISLDEWFESVSGTVIARDGYERVIGAMMRHVVTMFDTDGNGELDLDEFCALFTSCGLTRQDAADAFVRIDADGSGMLSVDEIDHAVHEFFTSADADVPGNWLFGPIEDQEDNEDHEDPAGQGD